MKDPVWVSPFKYARLMDLNYSMETLYRNLHNGTFHGRTMKVPTLYGDRVLIDISGKHNMKEESTC